MKYILIANPASKGGKQASVLNETVKVLKESVDLEVYVTQKPQDATQIARRAWESGTKNFMVAGGDGTIFEVLNGIFPQALSSNETPILGVLPLGTGNSFFREFTQEGLPFAVQSIVKNKKRACDLVELTHSEGVFYFINLLSIGFVADVGICRNEKYANWGELGYVLAVFEEARKMEPKHFSFTADKKNTDQDLLYVSINNSKFTGGKMMMAPSARVDDGKIDIIETKPMPFLKLLRSFPKIFSGTHVDLNEVHTHQSRSMNFSFKEPVNIMVDGEVMNILPQKLKVIPSALEVHA